MLHNGGFDQGTPPLKACGSFLAATAHLMDLTLVTSNDPLLGLGTLWIITKRPFGHLVPTELTELRWALSA
jgi:hypothetical protein